jgi:uncharacterized membrane protein YdjX (TVP38/TMEM64 family)
MVSSLTLYGFVLALLMVDRAVRMALEDRLERVEDRLRALLAVVALAVCGLAGLVLLLAAIPSCPPP